MSEGVITIGNTQLRITAQNPELLQAEAKRIADLPELPLSKASFVEKAKIAAALFTTPDAASRLDIIQKVLPEAKITRLGDDNAIIMYKGEMQFLNKPGLSPLDVADVGASIVKFLPAAKGAQAVGAFGKVAKVATAAGLSGATSVAEDLVAGAQGSEQGVIGSKVVLDTALGGGSELAAPLIGKAFKFAKGLFSNPASIVDGKLTPEAIQSLRESGLDVRQLRTALLDIVQREGPEALAASPDDIAAVLRKAEAGDLGVDLTKGQANRDFGQLSREDTLRTSDITTKSGRVLREFEDQQVGQLRGAAGQVQDNIAGGARTAGNIDDIGDNLVASLRSEYAAARKAVDVAYDNARQLDGSFSGESVADMTQAVRASLGDEIVTKELQPASFEILKRLKSLQSALTGPTTRPKRFDIKKIEVMRRQINNLINSAKNPDDKRVATRAKRAFDQWSDEAIDTAAFSGDEEALTALKKARAANTSLRSTFESTSKYDTPGKVVENLLNKDVTGREAVNYIFGVSALGQKQGATATVKRLKEILPEQQFNIVREGAWLRVMEKSMTGGRFSRPKALKAIDDALTGNGSAAMKELFSPEEFAQIRQFRRVVASTATPTDATGLSGTPRKIAQMFQQLAQTLGLAVSASTQNPVAALLAFTPQARQVLNFRAARQAARGFELPAQVSPAITATGVAVGREAEE